MIFLVCGSPFRYCFPWLQADPTHIHPATFLPYVKGGMPPGPPRTFLPPADHTPRVRPVPLGDHLLSFPSCGSALLCSESAPEFTYLSPIHGYRGRVQGFARTKNGSISNFVHQPHFCHPSLGKFPRFLAQRMKSRAVLPRTDKLPRLGAGILFETLIKTDRG